MAVEVIVLCDTRAFDCACTRRTPHPGRTHRCKCGGEWSGQNRDWTLSIVRLPYAPEDLIAEPLKAGVQ